MARAGAGGHQSCGRGTILCGEIIRSCLQAAAPSSSHNRTQPHQTRGTPPNRHTTSARRHTHTRAREREGKRLHGEGIARVLSSPDQGTQRTNAPALVSLSGTASESKPPGLHCWPGGSGGRSGAVCAAPPGSGGRHKAANTPRCGPRKNAKCAAIALAQIARLARRARPGDGAQRRAERWGRKTLGAARAPGCRAAARGAVGAARHVGPGRTLLKVFTGLLLRGATGQRGGAAPRKRRPRTAWGPQGRRKKTGASGREKERCGKGRQLRTHAKSLSRCPGRNARCGHAPGAQP